MEHDLVLEGKVVTPGGIEEFEVGVSDGRVKELGHGLRGSRKIRIGRCLAFPGFIDMHVHLREPGWERKEDFRTGTRAAIHGGVTTVVDMPNNPTPTDTREVLEMKVRLAKEKALVDVKFYGGIPRANPQALERLSRGVVGYKLYLSETTGAKPFPEEELSGVFRMVAATTKPLSVHCEDQAVIDIMKSKLHNEIRPDLHCDIRPPEAETRSVEKVVAALREVKDLETNICHASVGETLSIVKSARTEGMEVRCEAALHHMYFNRKAVFDNSLLKTNPPLRGEGDRQALVAGLSDGRVSFLVTDHAPHLIEEKESEGLAGVPGLDDYSHVVAWLIRNQEVSPLTLARAASTNPASHLGMNDRGEISPGKRADFSVLDLHSPEIVRKDDVRSRCGWSPYEGKEFPGRARWVICEGEVLMDDFELIR